MAIIHKIGNTTIDEPIGFDNFKTTIKRDTDYHGISVVSSVGTLEFTGIAAEMITDAYNTDIDTVLQYTVYDTDKDFTLFSGGIDLTTYQQKVGKYCSASVEIADINIRTEFNNLTKEKVDIRENGTIKGNSYIPTPATAIDIEPTTLKYVNLLECTETITYEAADPESGDRRLPNNVKKAMISIPLSTQRNDFGDCAAQMYCPTIYDQDTLDEYGGGESWLLECLTPAYSYSKQFEGTTSLSVSYNFDIDLFILGEYKKNTAEIVYFNITYYYSSNGTYTAKHAPNIQNIPVGQWVKFSRIGNDAIPADAHKSNIYIVITLSCNNKTFNSNRYQLRVNKGSYFKMTLLNTHPKTTYSKGLELVDAIREIKRKLDFDDNSLEVVDDTPIFNATHPYFIASGGMLRGNDYAPFTISFRQIIENLNCITPIGWHITKRYYAKPYYKWRDVLEIKKWAEFYEDDIILTINNPQEKTRFFDADADHTGLHIGYDTYQSDSDPEILDMADKGSCKYWSEVTLNRFVTSHENTKEVICSWIADKVKFEVVRKVKYETDENGEGNTHSDDKKIFLYKQNSHNSGYNASLQVFETMRNFGDYIFRTPNTQNAIPTSSETNFTIENLRESGVFVPYQKCLLKAERLELKFPITFAQYTAIIANPYGTVVVDGEKCYIQELQYKLKTGEAELKLIPKNE